jgi:hypothetical protein
MLIGDLLTAPLRLHRYRTGRYDGVLGAMSKLIEISRAPTPAGSIHSTGLVHQVLDTEGTLKVIRM